MTGDEKKKRDPIFTVCFVVFILAAVSVVGVYVNEHYLTEDNTRVAYGDSVSVNYVGTFYDFDGSEIAVEFDSGDLEFDAESGSSVLQKFWEACIGHKVDDRIEVTINPEDGYIAPVTGHQDVSKNGLTMDVVEVMSKEQFESIYDISLSAGSMASFTTAYGWNATAVLDSATQKVVVYNMPVAGEKYTYTDGEESEDSEDEVTVTFEVVSVNNGVITYNIDFNGQTSTGKDDEVQMIELQFGNETWQVTNIGDSTFSYKTSPNTTNQTLYFVIEITAIN